MRADVGGGAGHGSGGRRLWRAFLSGATQPSAWALLVAGVAALAVWGTAAVLITPQWIVRSPAIGTGVQYEEVATASALAMRASASERPILVTLGTSRMREAMDVVELNRALAARSSSPPRVYHLATPRQSLGDALMLVDQIPPGAPGVIVMGIGPGVLAMSPTEVIDSGMRPRLGLRSDALDELIRASGSEPPLRVGVYAVDNFRWLAPRWTSVARQYIRQLRQGAMREPLVHRYLGQSLSQTQWGRRCDEVLRRLDGYDDHADFNMELLAQVANAVGRRKNMTLLLVDFIASPRFVDEHFPRVVLADFDRRIAAFQVEFGVPSIDVVERARLRSSDFADTYHLNNMNAISRASEVVAQEVTEIVRRDGIADD